MSRSDGLRGRESAPPADRPSVTVKFAQTLDGRTATLDGQSQWISGQASLTLAHELRASHDAVMVGVGTVLKDNPRLTVRLVPGPSPLRIVADTLIRLPLECHLLSEEPQRTVVAAAENAPPDRVRAVRARGAQILAVRTATDGRLDLADLLGQLWTRGVRSVMVEGGAAIVTSLLRARLVDRLVVCIAPMLVGSGLDAVGDLGIRDLTDALTFSRTEVRRLGDDIIFDGALDASHESRVASRESSPGS